MWGNRNPLTLLVGMWSGAAAAEDRLAGPPNFKQLLCDPRDTPAGTENIGPPKNVHACVRRSVIHNSPKEGTTPMPLPAGWVNTLWYVHTACCDSTIRRKEPRTRATTWMSFENIRPSESSQSKKASPKTIRIIWLPLQEMSRVSKSTEVGDSQRLKRMGELGMRAKESRLSLASNDVLKLL